MKAVQTIAVLAFAASIAFAAPRAKPRDGNAAVVEGGGGEGITIIGPGQIGGGAAVARGSKAQPTGLGRWEPMKADANMTGEQEAKVKEIVQRHWDKRREWQASEEAKRTRELYRKLGDLGEKDDEASRKEREQLRKQIAERQAAQAKMATDEEVEVLGLLKPEQRLAWEKASLARRMAGHLRPLALGEKQQAKVDELVEKAAFRYVDLKDLTDRQKLDNQILDEIAKDVLDAAQTEKLKEMRAHRQSGWTRGGTTAGRIIFGGAGGGGGGMVVKIVGGVGGANGNVVVEAVREPTSKPAEKK